MGFSRQKYWSGVPLPSPEASTSGHQLYSLHFGMMVFEPFDEWLTPQVVVIRESQMLNTSHMIEFIPYHPMT